ncbi:helix-turn-helix domain-containing protein [Pseudodesulfovibrio piezophilus]|uniref:helix-turn-helix domain-containing protein n=1 Tax=Pseudodesulfovibrio piezophilus TaxID=879567 RepID=UPI002ADE8AA5|nr:helix-turn-helix domain-containing protein [Pseudodesulfovibrio piezophilus]
MSKVDQCKTAYEIMDRKDISTPPTLLTVREVAELLRVHQRTAYRLITGGSIRAIKIGSQWRVPEQALLDFINSGWQDAVSRDTGKSGPQQYKLPLE